VSNISEAIKLSSELKELLGRAGFNLTKWICNRDEVNEAVEEGDKSKRLMELTGCASVSERALGVLWHVKSDVFTYNSLSHQIQDKVVNL
jgi:hypothetical protein